MTTESQQENTIQVIPVIPEDTSAEVPEEEKTYEQLLAKYAKQEPWRGDA
jgi:hypothetical protein